jgi:hypothetical protein
MKKNKIIKILIFIVLIIIGAVIYFISLNRVDSQLEQISREINKQLPDTTNPSAVIEKTQVLPDRKFVYYIMIDFSAKELGDIEKFKESIYLRLLDRFKEEPNLEYFRKNDVTIIYIYSDKDGKELFVLEFPPQVY